MKTKAVGGDKRSVLWMCLALACAAPGLGGCSFLFSSAPPAGAERLTPDSKVDCSTSKAPPIADSVIAGLQAVRTGLAVAAEDRVYRDSPISREADIGIGLGLTALFLGSAIYGYSASSRCTEVKSRVDPDVAMALPPP